MAGRAYYNEHDPFAAQWLRNLIDKGLIAPGMVDERDIRDVVPSELAAFTQCHFFAGIGVWSLALRQAGWPDDRPVWTGSCPCQPFSAAGKRTGAADERHLWPHWHHLIRECRPAIVLGEQVASKDGLGWLDLVSADMEAAGYAFGAADLCAAGFGRAHIRQRLYFVGLADAGCATGRENPGSPSGDEEADGRARRDRGEPNGDNGYCRDGATRGLADADYARPQGLDQRSIGSADQCAAGAGGVAGGMANAMLAGRSERGSGAGRGQVAGSGPAGRLADADGRNASAERQQRGGEQRFEPQDCGSGAVGDLVGLDDTTSPRHAPEGRGKPEQPQGGQRLSGVGCEINGLARGRDAFLHPRQTRSLDNADWLLCRNPAGEPSWRPVEPGTFPLAHGVAARMGKLRAYGNGLDAETATGFVEALMEIITPEAAAPGVIRRGGGDGVCPAIPASRSHGGKHGD